MKDIKKLVEAVKAYANAHYEDGGWDVVVECWTDKEITDHLLKLNCTTEAQAIKSFEGCVGVWAERQADAAFHRREALGENCDG